MAHQQVEEDVVEVLDEARAAMIGEPDEERDREAEAEEREDAPRRQARAARASGRGAHRIWISTRRLRGSAPLARDG